MPYHYHHPSLEDVLKIAPFAGIMSELPVGFLPPGFTNPNYVPPDRGPLLMILMIIIILTVYPVVGFRFWVRRRTTGLGADDWLMFAALVSNHACDMYHKKSRY